MTARPHDALFKKAFEAPAHAAALLRALLPIDVRRVISWKTVRSDRASFVDAVLGDSHSDLLFCARLRTGNGVRLLLEHQSTDDRAMPLRSISYQLRIWERIRDARCDARIPPVIVVVISHAPGGWSSPRSLADMFDPSVMTIPAIAAVVPRFSLIIEDLARLTDEDLTARSLPAFQKLVLWVLRDARDPAHLLGSFATWAPTMAQLLRTRDGIDAFTILIRYMFHVVGPLYKDALRANIREIGPLAEKAAMTIADQLHAQGRRQGRKQGRMEGRMEGRIATLRSQLIFKFKLKTLGERYEARLRAATPETIDRYSRRVLSADSLAAVFKD